CDMPYPDGAFDCIFVMRLLHHVPSADERATMFKELRRKASKGVVISYFDAWSLSHLSYVLKRSLAWEHLQRHAISPPRMRRELQQAGLEIKRVFYRSRG